MERANTNSSAPGSVNYSTARRVENAGVQAPCERPAAQRREKSRELYSERPGDTPPLVALQRAMLSSDLQLRVCYCSIFDECWQSDLATLSLKPTPVKACQQPKVPFDQGLLKGRS